MQKDAVVPEAFLATPEARTLFEDWNSQQSDPGAAEELLLKFKQLSLSPPTLLATLMLLQYQQVEELPKEFEINIPDKSNSSLTAAIPLYRRLLKVRQFPVRPKNKEQAELTLRMLMTVLGDVQLLAVFLVLQLQHLEQLQSLSPEEADAAAWTALHVHAPLAGRLGIFWIKSELEDRAFRHLEYENYQNLKKRIARKRSVRSESVDKITKNIESILTEAGIPHQVQGRYKRFYSIFQKLEKVDNDFERIQDLIAFRILVNNVKECYAVLSFIHENWTPVENRFKDYIVKPKSNGYQSLHTTVTDFTNMPPNKSRPIEIQIRTQKMHRMAEYGVAAHWYYKEKQSLPGNKKTVPLEEALTEDSQVDTEGGTIPLLELYSENIYVMTPAREIRELPQTATPVDFAYAIHSEVGNRTTGAKTNGKITRLDSSLNSGDTVEILTSPRQMPRKEWLDFVKTRHARNKIKHALHEQSREVRRKEGLVLLEREFKSHALNLNRLIREGRLEQESRQHKNQEFEHILFCLGDGTIRSQEVRRWFREDPDSNQSISTLEPAKSAENKLSTRKKKSAGIVPSGNMILVDGMDNVKTRIAQCCSPVKKQPIQGYLTQERVITIHKENCVFLQNLSPERMITVHWGNQK
ncbi:MAG: bifunctional (p)ppGpp synthetase/guanosine-3',5'-bis(diphosphate) 3'-pyrophosphohydrolase [SAR324 cluster bacterium]|nr:bifunctional (p)ppGpp synthetase/guanosine-3',5'-bis(diphosphate) 3'-pyrophosphohydrolase [SAR324 cluster bacterium]MBL7034375.1 bifunctional (p)ppGpp synthetase/guanosine-3',5'-bis(diphosphate) 3'-pyrophosphohydrolase [SAR324 cluster bacterium]